MKKLFLLLLATSLLAYACNPVKRVLGDPEKFEQVAQEVVKRGYCVNDTTVQSDTLRDTVYQEVVVHDTVTTTLPGICDLDTTTASGFRVTIRQGVIHVAFAGKQKEVHTKTHTTSFIRDGKLENLLKTDIAALQADTTLLHADISQRDENITRLTGELGQAWFIAYSLGALLVLLVIGKLYLSLRKLVPILP